MVARWYGLLNTSRGGGESLLLVYGGKIMNYFDTCRTAEEAKALYKELAKKLHPDCGGSTQAFQELQRQFTDAWERLRCIHMTHDGTQYEKETDEAAEEYMDIIEQLMSMHVDVELCGSWLWITGDTKPYKNELKALGARWSANKTCWYIHRGHYRRYHNRAYSLDEIRGMYGSKRFGKKNKASEQSQIERRVMA